VGIGVLKRIMDMKKENVLMDQLVKLSDLRDFHLLNHTLLKTTQKRLSPVEICIFNFDAEQNVILQIKLLGDEIQEVGSDIHLDKNTANHISKMHEMNASEYSQSEGHLQHYYFRLRTARFANTCLCLVLKKPLSEGEYLLQMGLLMFYGNMYELLIDAQTDQLTGLYNRKTFDETINKVYDIDQHQEASFPDDKRSPDFYKFNQAPYWLVIIDIDHFKNVNDTYGHLYGDEVLILLAQLLKASCRENDFVFRFGGEEFALILHSPDRSNCESILNRLREKVAEYKFPRVDKITVSIGVCQIDRNIFHVTQLDQADQALYHSKNAGRNQVTFYEDLKHNGLASSDNKNTGEIDLF